MTEMRNDPLGRVKSVLDFDATTQRILGYKPWERVEETYFGTVQASNRKQHEESASDGLGRLKEVRSFPDAVGLGSSFKITAAYDAADRLLSVNDPVAASGNPSTFCSTHSMGSACPTQIHTTQVVWDMLGRKLQLNDPDAGVWSWEYFDSGLLKKQINGSAAAIERSYDGLERVVSQTLTPTGNGAYNASFTYGTTAGADYGRLKTATSTGGAAYTYWHDVPGRTTAMWQTSAGLTFKNDYSYDELDRRTGRRFPDQVWFYQDYDGLRMTKIRSDNGDRWALRTASYDAYGRPVQLELGRHATGDWPAAKLDYEYAGPGARLSKITGRRYTSASTSTVVMDQTSAFDGLGRLTSQGGTFNGQAISRSYGYDGLSRLTTASGPWETTASVNWTFGYDPLGNLRTLGSSSAAYSRGWTYANASRPRFLSSFVETGGGSPVSDTVTAEAGGNVGVRTRNSVAETFTWNAQNRLYAISGRGFGNHYDAFGRRDRQRVDVGAIHTDLVYVADDFEYDTQLQQGNRFFFVGGQRIASFASTFVPAQGEPWLDLEWAPPLLPPAAIGLWLFGLVGLGAMALRRRPPVWIASGGIGLLGGSLVLLPLPARAAPTQLGSHSDANGVYYLGDHLGSTRAVIDWAGALVETRDYDAFGRDIAHTGSYQLKHRFTSQPVNETESTATSPLYNYGARFYDPKWGRFISADERVEGFDSQGLNPYAYVRNRPTSLVDPTGSFIEGGAFSFSFPPSPPVALNSSGAGNANFGTSGFLNPGLPELGSGRGRMICGDVGEMCVWHPDDTLLLAAVAIPVALPWFWVGVGLIIWYYWPHLEVPTTMNVKPNSMPPPPVPPYDANPADHGFEKTPGNWHNPDTGTSISPEDPGHGDIGPHKDVNQKGNKGSGWRQFPDGRIEPKAGSL